MAGLNVNIIRILIILLPGILLPKNLHAQELDLQQKITIEFSEIPFYKVLDSIAEQSNISFSYNPKKIPIHSLVSVKAIEKPVSEILDELFNYLGIKYIVVEEQIVLRLPEKKEDEKQIPDKFTISGYVRNAVNGEILIGATIVTVDPLQGTTTNSYGFYSFTIIQGRYTVRYSYMGYSSAEKEVDLTGDKNLDIELEEDPSMLDEVVIRVNENLSEIQKNQMGKISIHPRDVQNMPALMGEVDVLKSLQSIPGINFFSDGSTLFYVRGGNKDQNLILLDEAPVYNPAHLLGFFSVFIPDAVKDIKVYKGNLPSQHGGRLSSLIDIKTKDGNMRHFGVSGNIGLVASRLSVEGPVIKDKSSFFVSGRRSYLKLYLDNDNPDLEDLYFSDLYGKLNFRINRNNRLFFSGYYGKDYFRTSSSDQNSSGINWGNMVGTIRWNHLFSDRLFSNTTLYASKYDYFLVTSYENKHQWNSHIANIGFKTDFTWYIRPESTLRFGIKLGGHNYNPGNFEMGDIPEGTYYPLVPRRNSRDFALYVSHEVELGEKVSLQYGFRLSSWENIGESVEYTFDHDHNLVDTTRYEVGESYHKYTNFEPRLGLLYRIGENSSLKASFTRTSQYIHMITNSVSPFTALEVWLPSSPNIKPQLADQFSIGWSKNWPVKSWHFQAEAYYRVMNNQIDYNPHAEMLLNPLFESELRFGEARAYGIELFVKKTSGRLCGWVGYSLSKTEKQIQDLYDNEVFPAFNDRPHDLSMYLNYKLSERTKFSANWIFSSGAAITTPTSFYKYNGYTVPIYAEKNRDRLPPYHRLDLSVDIRLNRKEARFEHNLNISVLNIYGRKNPFSMNFNKIITDNGQFIIPANLIENYELVSSQIYLYKVIPSLNYKFRF